MNRFVADPHWHGYIVWYFYLGGIAAGAYALASLAHLFGDEDDRRASRFARTLSGKNMTPNWQTTRSKLASGCGRSARSPARESPAAR